MRRFAGRRSLSGRMALFLLVVLAVLAVVFVDRSLAPTLRVVAEFRVREAITTAIYTAIRERVVSGVRYTDFFSFQTDARGKIMLMQPNTPEINRLVALTALEVQRALHEVGVQTIRIPLGQVIGGYLFAYTGPAIAVRVLPVGVARVTVEDEFEEAGINQTRHRIYMRVEGDMRVVMPLLPSKVRVAVQVPVAEGIIVGDVPFSYMNVRLGE